MILSFTKMNGAGNDFVLVDNRQRQVELSPAQVVRLCHRQRGIGADGLIQLIPCASGQADWAWIFHNSDGSVAEMCGNGARCFARFVQKLTGAPGPLTFETGAGIITANFQAARVAISLTQPKELKLDLEVPVSTGNLTVHFVNTGVPHAVIFVVDAEKAQVAKLGAEVRYHQQFAPRGTNVNFVQATGPNAIRVRTYERGVEGETLACGTGITASALVAALVHKFSSPVQVRAQGGDVLEVAFDRKGASFSNVRLIGPADFVFAGQAEL